MKPTSAYEASRRARSLRDLHDRLLTMLDRDHLWDLDDAADDAETYNLDLAGRGITRQLRDRLEGRPPPNVRPKVARKPPRPVDTVAGP